MSGAQKILVICPFPQGVAAGQRLKYEQYFDHWRRNGYEITVSSFMDMPMWNVIYTQGNFGLKMMGTMRGYFRRLADIFRVRRFDLVYVFMWVTPLGTSFYERLFRLMARRLVYDIEDNVLLEKSNELNPFVKLLKTREKTLYLIRTADHVITSSPFLNDYSLELNNRKACTYISSSVDTDRFVPVNPYSNARKVVIGWTGTFSSKVYLDSLRDVFHELAKRCEFRLRVIGNFEYELPGVDLEVIQWSKEKEVEDLQGIDIGVYPLPQNDWVLGKSGLKAIQYMAFGLPAVATNVGTTPRIIRHMENGWLVNTEEEWIDALEALVRQPDLRRKLGEAARKTVLDNYSTHVIASNYLSILKPDGTNDRPETDGAISENCGAGGKDIGVGHVRAGMMKSIRTAQDLAINGAPPAFEQPLHVGSPSIGNRDAFIRHVGEIFDRRRLTNDGPLVREFEQRVADYHGVKHCVAMCNGTVAMEIAIRALGLGGEVIVPSYTFIATAHALSWQGITPVFADIDPLTHNLDPAAVRRMITPRTTGIIAVHLWGRTAAAEALQEVADEYGLKLMFDAAHVFGCSHGGRMIGNFGKCEVLSFHATKFFNTFEGGAVLTNDDELAETVRLMHNFGFAGYDNVIHMGTNGKMNEVTAAMGLVNLESIDGVVESNRRNYQAYRAGLSGLPGISLLAFDESERNNFQYIVVEVGEACAVSRDQIVSAMHAENILARKYFWPGCHGMKPYRELYPDAALSLPNTVKVAERVVVLPTGTAMSLDNIEVVTSIIRVLAESGA